MLLWFDGDGTLDCPDEDGVFNAGQDTLVSDTEFILSPTTATARAQFVDKNGDGCCFAGQGPDSTRRCSNDESRPCYDNADCAAGGLCQGSQRDPGAPCSQFFFAERSLQGSPPTGPCCVVGQASTVVFSSPSFTGAAPFYDMIFSGSLPMTVSACSAPGSGSCTLTTDPCFD
jgi:hypothetical protein